MTFLIKSVQWGAIKQLCFWHDVSHQQCAVGYYSHGQNSSGAQGISACTKVCHIMAHMTCRVSICKCSSYIKNSSACTKVCHMQRCENTQIHGPAYRMHIKVCLMQGHSAEHVDLVANIGVLCPIYHIICTSKNECISQILRDALNRLRADSERRPQKEKEFRDPK
jgi:hypothetical protein